MAAMATTAAEPSPLSSSLPLQPLYALFFRPRLCDLTGFRADQTLALERSDQLKFNVASVRICNEHHDPDASGARLIFYGARPVRAYCAQ